MCVKMCDKPEQMNAISKRHKTQTQKFNKNKVKSKCPKVHGSKVTPSQMKGLNPKSKSIVQEVIHSPSQA